MISMIHYWHATQHVSCPPAFAFTFCLHNNEILVRHHAHIHSAASPSLCIRERKDHLCLHASSASTGINTSESKNTEQIIQQSRSQQLLTEEFISNVATSVVDGTFVSFTLRGPKAPRRKRRKGGSGSGVDATDFDSIDKEKERLRGCIRSVHGRLIALQDKRTKNKKRSNNSPQEQIFMQATTKYHGATDVAQNWLVSEGDATAVERGLHKIFLPDIAETDAEKSASEWGSSMLAKPDLGIRTAELITTAGAYELNLSLRKPKIRFVKGKDSSTSDNNAQGSGNPQIASHDRAKNVPLSPSEPFFQRLGVSNEQGKPRPGMSSKLRQCQKFCEIVGNLIEASLSSMPSFQKLSSINTADMGCGRGYLTFSLHSYLINKYADTYDIRSRGIEVRPKLVAETNGIAEELGTGFDGLRFAEGTIENVVLAGSDNDNRMNGKAENTNLNVLIALHACDTATDDALWSGIREGADVIVTAPCCHKEVRRQLDPYIAQAKDHVLADVLRHNIYRERMAETVTDSLRALLLEIANYSVQVFEFIGGEHTSKNVMITATKCRKERSDAELAELRQRLSDLAAMHGVKKQRLADWMGETVSEEKSIDAQPKQPRISSRRMPPHKVDPYE